MSVRERLANWLLNGVHQAANTGLDIQGMQSRYNATKERVLGIELTDLKLIKHFKIAKGRIELVRAPPAAMLRLTLDTLLNIINGEIGVRQQDGNFELESYTPFDAWRRGELVIVTENPDEGWLSDLTLFSSEIWQKAFPILKKFRKKRRGNT